jgi:Protein of unknown function (DUF1822)
MLCISLYSECIPLNVHLLYMMIRSSISPNSLGASLPEVMWIETHHFAQAKDLKQGSSSEVLQWQNYLNTLAFLGFSQWLNKEMSGPDSRTDHALVTPPVDDFNEGICQFTVGKFKLSLIAEEHILDETVHIPTKAIFKPELATHFYIALEVCQEEEQVILRGVLRYDQLTHYLRQEDRLPSPKGYHSIPLSLFDPEPNHLLSYFRYLDMSAIPLPLPLIENASTSLRAKAELRKSLKNTNTHLKNWLQDIV